MKYKKFGNTGLLVSELCLGTMTFGGRGFWTSIGELGQKSANDIISRSIEAGINFIDTANVYSEGESENILGQAMKDLKIDRDKVVIATKVRGKMGDGPNEIGLSRKHIFEQVKQSLYRLKTDFIDLYQIHGYDPMTPLEETLVALNDIVKDGYVRYIGCSNLMAWHIMKAIGISNRLNVARFESLQAYYTIAGRDLEREIVPLLNDQNIALMVWSPLAGGLLSGKFKKDKKGPEEARRSAFNFPPVNLDRAYPIIDAMEEIGKVHKVSAARVALAWLLSKKHVTSIIIGAKNVEQLNDNIEATNLAMADEELKRLDTISELPEEYPGWMINRQGTDRLNTLKK